MASKQITRKKSTPTRRRLTLRERRKRTRLIITLVSFVLLVGAGFGLSRLSFLPAVTVSELSIKGNTLVPTETLRALVTSQTASAYLGLFSKNNLALFPRSAIEEKITDTYKTITKASVSFDGLRAATITIQERKPAALWCASDCFYMDATGYIFAAAPQFNGGVYVAYSGDRADNTDTPVGTQFLPKADFEQLTNFVSRVGVLGVAPVSVHLERNGDGVIQLLSGGRVLFSRALDYNQTLENLQSIITSEQAKSRGMFLKLLDYVNVRFNGKAFFKLKPE